MKSYKWWVASLLLGWASSGFAADPKTERAKEIFATAKSQYDAKEYEAALENFGELLRVTENGAVYFNIAQCQRLLGRYEEAIQSYHQFLESNPKTPHREQIESKLQEMETALQKAKQEAEEKQVAASQAVLVESAYASTSQPIEPTSTWVLAPSAIKLLEEEMKSIEDTTQDSLDLALKRTTRLRYALPGGLALLGGVLGVGAISLHASMEASGETTPNAQRTLTALALGSDASFLAAGATFFWVVRKNNKEEQFYVGINPAPNKTIALTFRY